MDERKGYKLFEDKPQDKPRDKPTLSICARIYSYFYTYTVGSCLYFKNDADNAEETELKLVIQSTGQSNFLDTISREDDDLNNEWKRKVTRIADCKMKKRIQYHFKDHVKRWMDSDKRRFPWKLILHLLLVALVTTQVTLYSHLWLICIQRYMLSVILTPCISHIYMPTLFSGPYSGDSTCDCLRKNQHGFHLVVFRKMLFFEIFSYKSLRYWAKP